MMNFNSLVNELNSVMDSIINDQKKNEKTMKSFYSQLKEEEINLHKKLKKESSKNSRKKLERKLDLVKQAFGSLQAA